MIKNFEELKAQLEDLSKIVNGFKSEAVQLRIVEHMLGLDTETKESLEDIATQGKSKSTKKRVAKKTTVSKVPKKSGKKPTGQGAVAILGKLIEGDFFREPKSIGDIVKHCEHNLARKFKSSDFSGKLSRLVRESTLTRTKNAENQYEYQSK